MKNSNIFSNIPKTLKDEFFEDIFISKEFKIERIVSYGHSSPESGWYEEELNEWVILLEGEAILSFENRDDVMLQKGDYINITAFTKHKVSWTKPECNTVWLAIYY